MSMKEQLNADLKEAMKSKDVVRRTVIRGVMTAIKELEQTRREELASKALRKHNVTRPASDDPDVVSAYDTAMKAALQAEKVEENVPLDDTEVLGVIQKLIKMRQDSIDEAKKAGREDIVESEQTELEVLMAYMPRQMTREEIEEEARAMIASVGAGGPRDMGKVMGPLNGKLKGRADGRTISEVVRELLNQ